MVVKGYWNNPEVTQESFIGGFWRSGDMGRMEAEGFVYVLDRRKDEVPAALEAIMARQAVGKWVVLPQGDRQ